VQNNANSPATETIPRQLSTLHWLPVQQRIDYKVDLMTLNVIIIFIITSIFLKWPKQQTPPQGPLQSQSSKQAGSDSVVTATKQICL